MYIVRPERGTLNSKRLWAFILWSHFVMISSTLFKVSIVILWYVGMVFFHKAGAHTFTNHFQKSVSVYDMYFLSYVGFFFSLSISARFLQVCVCKDIFANYCQNIVEIAFRFLDLLYNFTRYFQKLFNIIFYEKFVKKYGFRDCGDFKNFLAKMY
jgi:hypothetical protein